MAAGGRRGGMLVSGAGVAGPVLAYWLHRLGFEPVVDLFGPALTVMGWMGLRDGVEEARTRSDIVSFAWHGRAPVEVPADLVTEGIAAAHVEIMRGDLAALLHGACRDDVEYVMGDSVASLTLDGAEVGAKLASGARRTVDLVVGADGLHSNVRRLVFGEEQRFLRFLGGCLAVFSVPNTARLSRRSVVYAEVGRITEVYAVPGTDQLRVLLLFRSREPDVGRHDEAARRTFVHQAYRGAVGEVARLLEAVEEADDFYLDSVSQVRMDTWSAGRVTLVGDAGFSTGPAVGGGTSLAVLGAYALATSLAAADGDVTSGLGAYESAVRASVAAGMTIAPRALRTLVPGSSVQAWLLVQAVRALPRVPGPVRRALTSLGGGPAAMLERTSLGDPADLGLRADAQGS